MKQASSHSAPTRGPADHDVRKQIVTAATEHFRLYGYEKTTMSDLARAIGFSKAYIYKFFESKQAIGEVVCDDCLQEISAETRAAVDACQQAPQKFRQMFRTATDASLRLFFNDRKLYDIAASAAGEHWKSATAYSDRTRAMLRDILQEGREQGHFERKTPLDETEHAIWLVMLPCLHPLLLQHNLDHAPEAPTHLSGLVLRSLSP